jgi:hypothetical protein
MTFNDNPMLAPAQPPPTASSRKGGPGCVLSQVVILAIVMAALCALAGAATSVGWAKTTYSDTAG